MPLPQLDPSMMVEQTGTTDPTPNLDPTMAMNPSSAAQPNLGDITSTQGPDAGIPLPQSSSISTLNPAEMKAEIDKMLVLLNKKATEVKGGVAANQQAMQASRQKAMGLFFDILKQAGVDPNDLNSISNFIHKLGDQDPDLAQMLEQVLNTLSSDPNAEQEQPQLMDKFKNLGKEMLQPRQ